MSIACTGDHGDAFSGECYDNTLLPLAVSLANVHCTSI